MSKPSTEHYGLFRAVGEGLVSALGLFTAALVVLIIVRAFADLHRIADSLETLAAECAEVEP